MNSPVAHDPPLRSYWQPRFWPLWLGLGVLRVIACLPWRAQRACGRILGRGALALFRSRRRVAGINLRLCFPELSPAEIFALLARHFESLGMQVIEIGMLLWASDAKVRRLVRVEGLEHLQRARAAGKGAIALSGHFSCTEFASRALKIHQPRLAALYRRNRNPLLDAMLRRSRRRTVDDLVSKESMRQMIRRLKEGYTVWYAPDQSYRRRYSVLIPFFGEPAMTNGALTHIARISGAPVVPFTARRLPGAAGYVIAFEPALEGFPTGDVEADARRVNAWLEERIRIAPEQYYWVHRRFKGRPDGYPDPYAAADAR